LSYVNPVFSPDGDWVALEQRRRGNSDIVLLSPETGQHIQITTSPVGDIDPTWSPDGSRLAFCYHTGGHNWEVFVYNFADGSLVNFSNSTANEYAPIWSPDGMYSAWISDVAGNTEICVVASTGDSLVRLTFSDWADKRRIMWR